MYHVEYLPEPGHPLCRLAEIRIYRTSADRRRALTQLRRLPGVHCTDFLETHGLALQIGRWRHGPFLPTRSIMDR